MKKIEIVLKPTKYSNNISNNMNIDFDIINNLKAGVEDLNTKFDADEWDSIEVRVSQFEKDVLSCLQTDTNILNIEYEVKVMGDKLYLEIRDLFNNSTYKLVEPKIQETKILQESQTQKKIKKGSKSSKEKLSKADQIRQENTLKTIRELSNELINTFNENIMQCDYGLRTNKILEFRGITFAYMSEYVLTKPKYNNKKKKLNISTIYELICSMQRFINTCSNYSGKSIADPSKQETVSNTLIEDVLLWLNKLKLIYSFDGITIYNTSPKLLIHSQYDDAIPTRGIHMRPNQKELMNKINSVVKKGFLMFYNASIGSGKTTLASVGIASLISKLRKNKECHEKTQLIFCCNLASVRRQVARNCWNSDIKFGIASYVKSTGEYKITNHWKTTDDDRIVIIAGPEVASMILTDKKLQDNKSSDNIYWLFLDEPTVGADIFGSRYLTANTNVMCNMPKWTILSSATMPIPEKIENVINHHKEKYPDIHIETLITKEINIGCDVKTYDYTMVIPHIGCKSKKELLACITKINDVPFLGRLYTFRVAEKLWIEMTNNNIANIINIKEYFADVDNLVTDKVRIVCMDMLKILSECSNNIIKKICSSSIISEEILEIEKNNNSIKLEQEQDQDTNGFSFAVAEKQLITNTIDFSKFGTADASKFLNMNLIVSLDPISTAKLCFGELLEDIRKGDTSISAIDIDRLKLFTSEYERKLETYNRNRENLSKTLGIDIGGKIDSRDDKIANSKKNSNDETSRKLINFEELATKRGFGKDDVPTINFPLEYQINTLQHWKKYGSNNNINQNDLRYQLIITELINLDYQTDDWLIFLLFAGVGIYAPAQIRDHAYLKVVLTLAEQGKLAYLVSDSSICYGTNYPINRVFITKDFANVHSINTVFQLMGRAGRVGQSWKAEIYLDNDTALKIIDYVQKPNNNSGDLEAYNITNTFDAIMKKNEQALQNLKEDKIIPEIVRTMPFAKKPKLNNSKYGSFKNTPFIKRPEIPAKTNNVVPPTNNYTPNNYTPSNYTPRTPYIKPDASIIKPAKYIIPAKINKNLDRSTEPAIIKPIINTPVEPAIIKPIIKPQEKPEAPKKYSWRK